MSEWFEQFGLDRDPFSDSGVRGLFFPGGQRAELRQQIEHLARFGNALIVLLGGSGFGKTSLATASAEGAAAGVDAHLMVAGLMDSPESLLRRILELVGAGSGPVSDFGQSLEVFAETVADRLRAGRRIWLFIDDAHHLDESCTRALCVLRQRIPDGLGLILLAEPQWEAVLRAQLPAAQDLQVLVMPSLEPDETVSYIRYRMKTAGLNDALPYAPAELERVIESAEGVPARINRAARQVLQEESSVEEQVAKGLPVWHIGVVGATLVALLLLYVWGAGEDERQRDVRPQPQALVPPAVFEETVPVVVGESETEISGEDDPDPVEAAGAAQDAPPRVPPARSPYDAIDGTASVGAEASPPSPQIVNPVADAGEKSPPPAADAQSADAASGSDAYEPDERWLLDQPGGLFTMQLLSTDDPSALATFRRSHGLAVREFRKRHKGREWRALVYGTFADRAAAAAAAAKLPASLRKSQPWIRSIASVQAEIRAARGP